MSLFFFKTFNIIMIMFLIISLNNMFFLFYSKFNYKLKLYTWINNLYNNNKFYINFKIKNNKRINIKPLKKINSFLFFYLLRNVKKFKLKYKHYIKKLNINILLYTYNIKLIYKLKLLSIKIKKWLLWEYFNITNIENHTDPLFIDNIMNYYNNDLWYTHNMNLLTINTYNMHFYCIYKLNTYINFFYFDNQSFYYKIKNSHNTAFIQNKLNINLNIFKNNLTFNYIIFNYFYFMNLLNSPLNFKLYYLNLNSKNIYNYFWKNTLILYKYLIFTNFFFKTTNLWPITTLTYNIKKQFLILYKSHKFSNNFILYYNNIIIRFLEYCTGLSVFFKISPFILKSLNFFEILQCLLWARKLKMFRKLIGPQLFLNESLQLTYLALQLKDTYLLSNWIVNIMQKINFWKHRLFFRYLKYIFKTFFYIIFKQIGVIGVRIQLQGKISVAGNARTRKLIFRTGRSTISTTNLRVNYDLNLIKTFTGVIGLKIWFFY